MLFVNKNKLIIRRLKKYDLRGRSGSNFPVWLKWQAVKKAKAPIKYVICNGAEGEPFSKKDYFILKNYPQEVVNGMKLAMQAVGAKTGYLYLKKDYYRKLKKKFVALTHHLPIELVEKQGGYLAGEETALLNVIEGKKPEPRIKPPYPSTAGLFGRPTLINNVETLYFANQIAKKKYKYTRFFSVNGKVRKKIVAELPFDFTIKDILTITGNRPNFDYFVQVGGGASGQIMLPEELDQPINNLGTIIVYDRTTTNPLALMRHLAKFFLQENCDRCAPCREGTYRVNEILQKDTLSQNNRAILSEILNAMEKSSLCPFGKAAVSPLKTGLEKLF